MADQEGADEDPERRRDPLTRYLLIMHVEMTAKMRQSRNINLIKLFFRSSILQRGLLVPGIVACLLLSPKAAESRDPVLDRLSDPYLRPKNGPPLTKVVQKVDLRWFYRWLKDPPSHDPTAQMPNLQLELFMC